MAAEALDLPSIEKNLKPQKCIELKPDDPVETNYKGLKVFEKSLVAKSEQKAKDVRNS